MTREYARPSSALKRHISDSLKLPPTSPVLTGKLNFYNARQNILTRFFTAEYSLWFDLTPHRASIAQFGDPLLAARAIISGRRHSLKLEGWDPFKRDWRRGSGCPGYSIRGTEPQLLNSTTLKKRQCDENWLRQRSRWLKGYMQTYLVHMRNIGAFRVKVWSTILFSVDGRRQDTFCLLNPFMWIMTLLVFCLFIQLRVDDRKIYIPPISYIGGCIVDIW